MILIIFVLGVYYRTQFAEICLVDDVGALSSILTQEHFSWKDNFLPRTIAAGYYRPIIGVSYWFDKWLWFLDPKIMHFESVLGHLFNCLMFFYIARKHIVKTTDINAVNYAPLFVSLLFAVHPLTVESVNWISGRTDIIMGNFLLMSMVALLWYRETGKYRWLFIMWLMAGIALLVKEVALGYIIILPLLLRETVENVEESQFNLIEYVIFYSVALVAALFTGNYWGVIIIALFYLVAIVVRIRRTNSSHAGKIVFDRLRYFLPMLGIGLLLFYGVRKVVLESSVSKIGQTIQLMFADTNYTISLFLGAVGFYVKKFFLPLPLNFFILEIDPLYDLLGIAVLLGVIFLLTQKNKATIYILTGFMLLAPALPFAFGTIAWASYAERYLYASSVFWLLSLMITFEQWRSRHPLPARYLSLCIILILAGSTAVTHMRNTVWLTNESLMRDTVSQTPRKRILQNIYICSLLKAEKTDEAIKQYELALNRVPPSKDDEWADIEIGRLLVKQNRYEDALTLYRNALKRNKFSSEPILIEALRVIKLLQEKGFRYDLQKMAFEYNALLASLSRNPYRLVEEGKWALNNGSFEAASLYFDKALSLASPDDGSIINMIKRIKITTAGSSL